jgi:transcription antitermination factor NusG
VTEGAAHCSMNTSSNWFVIYTKSRQEKVLATQLLEAGYEVFLPLLKKVSQWSDRKKLIEVPMFNSYIFIKGVNDKSLFIDFKSFVCFLTFSGKPAIVWQHEIDVLKTIIKHGYDVSEASDLKELKTGSKVMVIAGPLKGLSGELLSIDQDEWFLINFENIGNSLQVKIPPQSLKKI